VPTIHLSSYEQIDEILVKHKSKKNLVIFMGAGDVSTKAKEYFNRINT